MRGEGKTGWVRVRYTVRNRNRIRIRIRVRARVRLRHRKVKQSFIHTTHPHLNAASAAYLNSTLRRYENGNTQPCPSSRPFNDDLEHSFAGGR